ncbi:hypothetical protein [Vibrio sp. D431a]|uniref:hypothetical protein n=1 Tax=Vibrio sp. D431a TaxID=2837388 RepID=UPI002553CD78|nr:hypothetical protein [Vibrio sp. D431a]MDK9793759.1 hypothetical protein [Vibrio sp. D431a]
MDYNQLPETQQRIKDLYHYYESNKPPAEVLERFKDSIKSLELTFPLYCPESDTLSGIIPLLFTRAIAHDISLDPISGFSERYCFESDLDAVEQLIEWHKRGFNDMRPSGWVAVRKISSSKVLRESFEKYYRSDYAHELLPYGKSDDGVVVHAFILDKMEEIRSKFGYTESEVKHLAAYLRHTGQAQ